MFIIDEASVNNRPVIDLQVAYRQSVDGRRKLFSN